MEKELEELEKYLSEFEAAEGGWILHEDECATRIMFPDFGKLYLGGLRSLEKLRDEVIKVDTVISLCEIPSDRYVFDLGRVEHFEFLVRDDPTPETVTLMKKICEQCSDILDTRLSNKKKVLVHCAAGMSRSATVVLHYFITKYATPPPNVTPKDLVFTSLKVVKSDRKSTYPNRGFLELLLEAAGKKIGKDT